MRILGIDPSLRKTGWGIIDVVDYKINHIDHNVIMISSKDPIQLQLYKLSNGILNVYQQYLPDKIAIEETFCGVNSKTNLKLGFVCGAIMSQLGKLDIDITMYPTRVIKMNLISGNATKEDIRIRVMEILNISKISSFDMSDALATAICCANTS